MIGQYINTRLLGRKMLLKFLSRGFNRASDQTLIPQKNEKFFGVVIAANILSHPFL